jgi:hypothetical protein
MSLGLTSERRSSLQAITPIVRPAMQMGDRQHQYVVILDSVDQPVREAAETAPANALAQRMLRLREARDTVCSGEHLN